jgi:hypothetical protein
MDPMKWLPTTRTWRDQEGFWQKDRTFINLDHVRRVSVHDDQRSKILWATPGLDPTIIDVSYDMLIQLILDL